MTRQEAETRIKSSLAKYSQDLLAGLKESIRLRTIPIEMDDLPLGASRLGGRPDLPSGFPWPVYTAPVQEFNPKTFESVDKGTKEARLHFIAQINLADCPAMESGNPLPSQGTLCFFYDADQQPWGFDPKHKGAWGVHFFDGPTDSLVRVNHADSSAEFGACRMEFQTEWTLDDRNYERLYTDMSVREREAYEELAEDSLAIEMPNDPIHRLHGNPQLVQNPMEMECQMAFHRLRPERMHGREGWQELKAGAKDWQLLLQIDSDDNAGWMWGDCGRIYYWIRKQDLQTLSFENAWLVLQCS